MEGNRLKENSAGKQRIYLYDNIKFIAIILVVIGHSIDFITNRSGNHLEKSLFLTIYSVHMPLFIFVSGLFVKPMDKSAKFPKQKVISYLLIGMSIRVVFNVLKLILNESIEYAVLDMYDTYSWFMLAMAVYSAVVWLFREYDFKFLLFFSTLIGCMAGYDKFLGDEFALLRVITFLPFFIAGYMLTPEALAEFLSQKRLKIVSVVFIALIVIWFFVDTDIYKVFRPLFTGRNGYSSLDELKRYGGLLRLVTYIISAFFGVAVMSLVPNKKIKGVSAMGTKTLQIYFWHAPFIKLFEHFRVYDRMAGFTGDTLATLIYILLMIGVTFLCSLNLFSFLTKQLMSLGKPKGRHGN